MKLKMTNDDAVIKQRAIDFIRSTDNYEYSDKLDIVYNKNNLDRLYDSLESFIIDNIVKLGSDIQVLYQDLATPETVCLCKYCETMVIINPKINKVSDIICPNCIEGTASEFKFIKKDTNIPVDRLMYEAYLSIAEHENEKIARINRRNGKSDSQIFHFINTRSLRITLCCDDITRNLFGKLHITIMKTEKSRASFKVIPLSFSYFKESKRDKA